jgi:hypothetical protein
MHYICTQSWVPLRAEASSASEMVSSLLFGETCKLLQKNEDWLLVACSHDDYQGWIPESYITVYSGDRVDRGYKVSVHGAVMQNSEGRIDLSPGAIVPENGNCIIDGKVFRFSDARVFEPEIKDVTGLAMLFLHTPYLWGGRSVWGIDCSGLVQVAYGILGIPLPRDASQQVNQGIEIDYADSCPGDLAFFEKQGKITHVGILLPEKRIIHASGKVRIDHLTESGIVNSQSGQLTHSLSCFKRL